MYYCHSSADMRGPRCGSGNHHIPHLVGRRVLQRRWSFLEEAREDIYFHDCRSHQLGDNNDTHAGVSSNGTVDGQHGESKDANRIRGQLHVQDLFVRIRQLLLVSDLYCLFQGNQQTIETVKTTCITNELLEDINSRVNFQGRFFVHPGDADARASEFYRIKTDVCDPAGCLSEVCIQLAIIMVGKQCFNNFVEILSPKLWNWWRKRTQVAATRNHDRKYTCWEKDYQLQDPGRLALFDEYLEMSE